MIQIGDYHSTKEQVEAILEVLHSNRLSPTYHVKEFEKQFSQRHGCLYGLMTNSGTDALRVIMAAMKEKYDWEDGDKVFVPALTFPATINAVIQNNLFPVPLDVSMYDYNLNPYQIDRRHDEDVKAVMVVHLAGQMAEMDILIEMCRKYDLKLIEDSCETVGVDFKGRSCGSWGDAAAFSFYMAHHITAGVGGMITTNDRNLNDICRSLINHGRSTKYIPGFTGIPGLTKEFLKSRYLFDRIGYSCRPTEFEASLGIAQLKDLDWNIASRRHNAEWLTKMLSQYSDLVLTGPQRGRTHSWMFYPILIREGSKIDKYDLCLHLEKSGIETRDLFPLIEQPCYKEFGWKLKMYPTAKGIQDRGFFIGCHPWLTNDDLVKISGSFHSFFNKNLTKQLIGAIN